MSIFRKSIWPIVKGNLLHIKNISLILLASFCISLISCRKSQCIEGDCFNGVGIFQYKNNGIDSGEFKNGKLTGFSKVIFGEGEFKGDIYIGQFSEGLYNGHGTYYHSKYDVKYIGLFTNGKRNGRGMVVFGDNSIQGSKIFYGTWENGTCEEYEKFIRISKNDEYVFYSAIKFLDSIYYHINYSTKFVDDVLRLANELHLIELDKRRVRYEDIKAIIDLINQGTDTTSAAINRISNLKEFDDAIPLKEVTLKFLELRRNNFDNEFRSWAMRLQYKPSTDKLSQLQAELYPMVNKTLAIQNEFNETLRKFKKKYSIVDE